MIIESNYLADFQKKVLKTIRQKQLIEAGDKVVVGVSGGPDSVCLLHVLYSFSEELDIELYPIHINHMLRGEDALEDEEYTRKLCNDLGLPLSVVRADVAAVAKKMGTSIETAGRKVRYSEFEKLAEKVGAGKIAVAHNRNDQAETVMMHIIRGTGLSGLVGMEYKRGAIIRPLLDIGRDEIEAYCNEAKLAPRTDKSNLTGEYARNRVRLELFPYIDRSFGANIVESLCRLSSLAADDDSFMESCAADAYENCLIKGIKGSGQDGNADSRDDRQEENQDNLVVKNSGQVELDIEGLKKLHPSILMRVLRRAIANAAGNIDGIGKIHYEMLSDLINTGKTGSVAELPHGLRGLVSYGVLRIFVPSGEDKKNIKFDKHLVIPGATIIEETGDMVLTSVEKRHVVDKYAPVSYNSLVQFFDYEKLNKGINLRNRRDGDIFKPLGSNGTKKLKEYFIDMKIPRELRDEIPLVCINNEVVWVVGHKISDKFKVTENTNYILKIEYKRRALL